MNHLNTKGNFSPRMMTFVNRSDRYRRCIEVSQTFLPINSTCQVEYNIKFSSIDSNVRDGMVIVYKKTIIFKLLTEQSFIYYILT